MRVAILGSRGIPANYGGFETFAEELSVRLVQQGIDVTVYCEGSHDNRDTYKSVTRVFRTVPQLGAGGRLLFDVKCLWDARHKYDVVYMLGYGAGLFCFIPRIWGTQVWINMDGVEWARPKWSWLARVWLKMMEAVAMWTPNRIVADAEAIKLNLAQRYSRMPTYSVIPYGAHLVNTPPPVSVLDEWSVEPYGYYLVVCRLVPENHLREIIEGYIASLSMLPLLVVGNRQSGTQYVNDLLALTNERVRFVGTVYNQNKLQALRCYSRAYFHGHSMGGTNPSLLEAMGCGNVIIAHENPFNREVAGEAATYFSSAQDIPALLEKLDADEAETLRMKGAAKNRVATTYTWDAIVKAYLDLINHG